MSLVFMYTLTTYAQKNSWYAGGELGFNSRKTESSAGNSDKSTSWKISPEIGTFLTDHVQLGVGLTVMGSEENNTKALFAGGTVYTRYFFGSGAFRPFAGFNVSVLPGKIQSTGTNESTVNSLSFSSNLNAGFGYALSPRVTVVGSFGTLGFSSVTQKNDNTGSKTTNTSFGLDAGTLGNRFNIGIYYTFK